ncbi:MAG: biotin--[acetyl-CoA-carboxylase] ligase [Pseudomonadota bacterium]
MHTARSWPDGYARLVFDSLDSTLSEAARMLPDVAGPTWILAHEQTAARGRRGRGWATPKGNFAATLILRRAEPPATAALRSFVTSLALYRSFAALTGRADTFALKWPNDVLLQGGKVAGILLESVGDHLVIGIGVNLAHAPDAAEVEAGALRPMSLQRDLGLTIAAEDMLDTLATEYAAAEAQFQQQGFEPIRRAWLAQAARLGEGITARTMRQSHQGTFEDVDAAGNLVLRSAKGVLAIPAADVFF